MTRERDHIQENANKFIVKNCPCYWHIGEDDGCSLENMKSCEDDTDCVIKYVIDLCKKEKEFITVNGYQAILNMFDIEEINK